VTFQVVLFSPLFLSLLSEVEMQKVWSFPVLLSLLAAKQGRGALLGLLLLSLFILPAALFGEEAKKEAGERVKPQTDFVLTIQDNLLSLKAQQASLQAILDEIGRQMHIEVVAQIPAQEKITFAFDRLSLEEALQRFGDYTNYVYVKGAEKEPGQISKIMIFPKRETIVPSSPPAQEAGVKKGASKEAPRPEPFKFEFDPSQYEEKSK
jgi:hypothetical protein